MLGRWIRRNKASFGLGIFVLLLLFLSHRKVVKIVKVVQNSAWYLNLNERVKVVNIRKGLTCSKWAVTLSNEPSPSEGIRRFMYDESWCLVVVTMAENPNFRIVSSIGKNIFVLDETEQRKIHPRLAFELLDGRNLGYLFAIAHGAKMIFDFDARTEIKFWMPDTLPRTEFASLNDFENPSVSDFGSFEVKDNVSNCPIYDPYMNQRASSFSRKIFQMSVDCNYRGDFILNDIKEKRDIGILHSSIDSVGGITSYRNSNIKKAGYLLPKDLYTTFGPDSSIYYPSSFWALFIPSGVNKRNGNILRSFVAKLVCDILNINMGFTSKGLSWVRMKNVKHIQKDELTFDIKELIKDLSAFKNAKQKKATSSPQLILDIWNYLYKKNYIYTDDLFAIQSWIQTLVHLNYRFPGETQASDDKIVPHNAGELNLEAGKPLTTIEDISPKCVVKKHKTFWTSDIHDGCRSDFPLVLSDLNQTVWVSGIKKKQNRYGIFEYPGVRFSENLSPTVRKIVSHSSYISDNDIKINLEYYKKHPINVDGFFCEFPASMCEIWMPLQKSIIFIPAHRYNLGRCSIPEWERLNLNLEKLDKKHNFMGALSRYDVEYFDHYTNLSPRLFPSYSGVMLKNYTYRPKVNRFVFIGLSNIDLSTPEAKRQNIVKMKPYKLKDLVESQAIIYDAYSVMSYKLTEFYNMGIPLLMPSLTFYRARGFGEDRTSTSSNYCKNPSLSSFPPISESAHPFNPNLDKSQDPNAELYWLQYSDFYDWPHVIHYDNITHLHHLIDNTDFKRISSQMLIEVKIKKEITYKAWCEVINQM